MNSALIKSAVALPLAAVGTAFGAGGFLVVLFVVAALTDWLTGTLKAMKKGQWTSSTAREGLWHKTGEIISLLVAAGVDIIIIYMTESMALPDFRYTACLLPVVCVWYICTELGSILENIGELGAPIPAFLRRMIALLKDTADRLGDNDTEGVER